jgi:hypothetical protein
MAVTTRPLLRIIIVLAANSKFREIWRIPSTPEYFFLTQELHLE